MNGFILLTLVGAELNEIWVNPELIAAMSVLDNGTELALVGTPITFAVVESPKVIFSIIDSLDSL